MRLAQIEAGVVVNVIIADPDSVPDWCADWPECPDGGPGWTFDGETYSPPSDPE